MASTEAQQLKEFLAKFEPAMAAKFRACRAAMRKRLPGANEFVYDNYNFFVIGYGPTERPSECQFSIAANAKGVSLCFLFGAKLPDPDKLLQGGGGQVRFLRLENAAQLSTPKVERLIAATLAKADPPYPTSGRGKLIIRSISAKQRPRK